ncbi:hypothetical protein L3V43_04965 [Pseudoalteromonas sp. L23]|uniref:hypothetical protein n=1 Tax=unclassified Pseudoalteromonas TaxID=194690 RepID=UPI001EF0EB9B|nr:MULTISPECIES: hypothetical protein [unclassified Pseudoalteromonas]MCF7512954.1 hypothetical protein [Pseudoalteromonas sp. L7]MCF7524994.1 hypothetical protein [Pseudoalteromonas sp. L23]
MELAIIGITIFLVLLISIATMLRIKLPNLKSDISNGIFLGLLLAFTSSILLVYVNKFGFNLDNTDDFGLWESVAVYLNNMLQPILLGASIFLLYKTWQTSETELKETRKVLKSQTELLLFDKITDNLHYLTDNVKNTVTEDFKVTNEVFDGEVEKLKNSQAFYGDSCFWIVSESFEQKWGREPRLSYMNIGCNQSRQRYMVNIRTLLYSAGYGRIANLSKDEAKAKIYAQRVLCKAYLTESSYMLKKLDKAILELMNYLSQIETPELRKIIFTKTRKNLGEDYDTNLLYGFYSKRIFLFSEVRNNKKLFEVVKDYYDHLPTNLPNIEDVFKLDAM